MFEKCEFCQKLGLENVNFDKIQEFENVNFVKSEVLKM